MKKIIFLSKRQKKTIEDLKDLVVSFLSDQGMIANSAKEFVSAEGGNIVVRMDCGNSDYTRAAALLQLIFADDSAPAWVKYNPTYSFAIIPNATETIEAVYDFLEDHHSDINIEY